jgi:non-ribosomal peptide synthetase component F
MRLSPTEMQQHFALNPPTFQAFFATLPQQHIDTIADLALLFDVTLAVSEDTSTTLLTLLYRSGTVNGCISIVHVFLVTDLFEEERMKETLSQLEYLFKQITQNSEENIQKYSLLTPTARKHLPDVKEPLDATWIGSIHEHFHKNALKNPDKIAAVHKTDTLTYNQ